MNDTMIISAFPACGKTYFYEHSNGMVVLDSDSSNFSWIKDADGNNTKERNPNFPENYIEYIKSKIGIADYILVSSHQAVRNALRAANIEYLLVYPDANLLDEWVQRCEKRSYNGFPIQALIDNWNIWVSECEDEAKSGVPYVKLSRGQYLSDIIKVSWKSLIYEE